MTRIAITLGIWRIWEDTGEMMLLALEKDNGISLIDCVNVWLWSDHNNMLFYSFCTCGEMRSGIS